MVKEYEYIGKAMGTDFSIAIIADSKETADIPAHEAIEQLHSYEKRFSRFIPESELSILNRQKDMIVSEEFISVLKEAYSLFITTQGIFNPLLQIERFGYTKNFDEIEIGEIAAPTEPYDIDFSSTSIDFTTRRIVLQHGQKIDLGGILKGYLASMICQSILTSPSITGAIVNIGGDIHTQGYDSTGKHFIFEIYNPVLQKNPISLSLHNQSLATSGTYKRTWQTSEGKKHHILNALGNDNPHSDIVSASVITADGATSEAYAKVFLSVGEIEALKILQHEKLSYILIKINGDVIQHI